MGRIVDNRAEQELQMAQMCRRQALQPEKDTVLAADALWRRCNAVLEITPPYIVVRTAEFLSSTAPLCLDRQETAQDGVVDTLTQTLSWPWLEDFVYNILHPFDPLTNMPTL